MNVNELFLCLNYLIPIGVLGVGVPHPCFNFASIGVRFLCVLMGYHALCKQKLFCCLAF